jgi:hypothetical protein
MSDATPCAMGRAEKAILATLGALIECGVSGAEVRDGIDRVLAASECLHATVWDDKAQARRTLCQPNVAFAINESPRPHMTKWRKCSRCMRVTAAAKLFA